MKDARGHRPGVGQGRVSEDLATHVAAQQQGAARRIVGELAGRVAALEARAGRLIARLVVPLLAPLVALVVLLASALPVSGCGPTMVSTVAPGNAPIEVFALAVYPFQIRGRSDPALSYQKTVDLVSAAIEPRRFLVYSFGDFQVFSLDTVDAYEGRSLLSVARGEGLDLNRLGILKGEAAFLAGDDPSGEVSRQSGHRNSGSTRVKAWVELYNYGLRQPIARAEAQFEVSPLDATQVDPYPALTQQVRRLASRVMTLASKRATTPPVHPTLPVTFYADQSMLFRIASDDAPSIARKMLSLDEVDKAAALLRGYQYFYPEISLLQVQRLNVQPGLLVTGIQESWLQSQGLKVGDLITQVNGNRIETAHQFDRQLARVGTAPLQVTVVRADKEMPLVIKWP